MLVGAASPPSFLNSSSSIPSLSVSLESAKRELGSCGRFIFPCVYINFIHLVKWMPTTLME